MSSPFPLLRLPGVVLFEVFKSLNIGEKIKLSLCSKKLSTQFNIARFYSQKVIVNLDMLYQNVRVHSENNKDSFTVFICPVPRKGHKSNAHQLTIECCITGITTFWKNDQEGFLFVIRHLLKIFQCKISTDCSIYDGGLFQPTILMLFDQQVEFKKLTIRLKESEDENLFWNQMFSNFGLVEDLTILSSFSPSFRPVFTSWPRKINIRKSDWVTLDSLLACTCTIITLGWSHLKIKDLDEILNNWKAGQFPNLERLKIHSHNIRNNRATILGMNLEELDGKVIQNDDGSKKAAISLGFSDIRISVTPF